MGLPSSISFLASSNAVVLAEIRKTPSSSNPFSCVLFKLGKEKEKKKKERKGKERKAKDKKKTNDVINCLVDHGGVTPSLTNKGQGRT